MWKSISFFRRPRFAAVFPLVILGFLFARTTAISLWAGLLVALLGEILRFWANGYVGHRKVNQTSGAQQKKIGQLMTGGPYAYVRHPLYLGTLLIGIGFCTMIGNLWLGLIVLLSFLLFYKKKMAEEEQVLEHEWGEEFKLYRAAVPQWLPLLWRRRYPRPHGSWSWKGVKASKEWKTLLWITAATCAFYLREALWIEWELSGSPGRRHFIVLGLLVFIMAGAAFLELWQNLQHKNGLPKES